MPFLNNIEEMLSSEKIEEIMLSPEKIEEMLSSENIETKIQVNLNFCLQKITFSFI